MKTLDSCACMLGTVGKGKSNQGKMKPSLQRAPLWTYLSYNKIKLTNECNAHYVGGKYQDLVIVDSMKVAGFLK